MKIGRIFKLVNFSITLFVTNIVTNINNIISGSEVCELFVTQYFWPKQCFPL